MGSTPPVRNVQRVDGVAVVSLTAYVDVYLIIGTVVLSSCLARQRSLCRWRGSLPCLRRFLPNYCITPLDARVPLRWLIVWLIFSHAPRATHPGDAGQSNMVFPLHLAFNVTQEVASLAESPTQFRFFQTARDYSDTPQFDLKPEPACESTPITTHRVIVLVGTGGLNGISVPPRRHPAGLLLMRAQ